MSLVGGKRNVCGELLVADTGGSDEMVHLQVSTEGNDVVPIVQLEFALGDFDNTLIAKAEEDGIENENDGEDEDDDDDVDEDDAKDNSFQLFNFAK